LTFGVFSATLMHACVQQQEQRQKVFRVGFEILRSPFPNFLLKCSDKTMK
jgi:hypothetical protein